MQQPTQPTEPTSEQPSFEDALCRFSELLEAKIDGATDTSACESTTVPVPIDTAVEHCMQMITSNQEFRKFQGRGAFGAAWQSLETLARLLEQGRSLEESGLTKEQIQKLCRNFISLYKEGVYVPAEAEGGAIVLGVP